MSKIDEAKVGVTQLSDSLKSLEDASFKAGIEFQGMLGSLTKAAYSLNDAGKGWTTFSRLVSGSPLWAIQNKFRAYLSILASFEQRSKNNTDAQIEQRKRVLDNFEATKKLNESVKDLSKIKRMEVNLIEQEIKLNDQLEKQTKRLNELKDLQNVIEGQGLDASDELLNDMNKRSIAMQDLEERIVKLNRGIGDSSKEIMEEVKSLDIYKYTLASTGSEEKAFIRAKAELIEKQKEANKQLKAGERALKEQFAFDKKRLEFQMKAAEKEAKRQGLTGRARKKFLKEQRQLGQRKMKEDQKEAIKTAKKENLRTESKTFSNEGIKEDFKGMKLALAPFLPLVGVYRLAKNQRKIALKAQKFRASMIPVLNLAFKFFVFGIMGILAFLLFIKGAYEVFKILKEMGLIEEIKEFFFAAWEIALGFIGVISTFISGDFKKAFKDLGPLLDKVFILALNGLGLFIKVAWETIVATFYIVMQFLHDLIFDESLRERAISIGLKIGKIILGAYLVKTLALMALQLVATYAAPILLGVFILAGLYALAKFVYNRYALAIVKPFHMFFDFIKKIGEFVRNALIDIKDFVKDLSPFSEGGRVNSNFQLVGEKGPEIVKMPRGSTVYSNAVSKQMISRGSNTVVNNMSITINARDTSDAELRRIADKIGNMVNNKINRRTSSRTLG